VISRTSIYTAAGRAIGARDPDPSVRNPDYLAEKLLGDPSAFEITHAAVQSLGLGYDEAMKNLESSLAPASTRMPIVVRNCSRTSQCSRSIVLRRRR
jgi:hypothetical protein